MSFPNLSQAKRWIDLAWRVAPWWTLLMFCLTSLLKVPDFPVCLVCFRWFLENHHWASDFETWRSRGAALHCIFWKGTAAAESGWGLDAVSVLCQPAPKQAEAWQRDSSIGDGHDAHDVHDMQMSLSKSIGWSLVSNQLSLLQIACWDISILRLQCFEDLHRTHHSHPHHAGSSMPGMCWSCLGQSHHARKRKSRYS